MPISSMAADFPPVTSGGGGREGLYSSWPNFERERKSFKGHWENILETDYVSNRIQNNNFLSNQILFSQKVCKYSVFYKKEISLFPINFFQWETNSFREWRPIPAPCG